MFHAARRSVDPDAKKGAGFSEREPSKSREILPLADTGPAGSAQMT